MWLETLRIAKEHGKLDDLIPDGIDGLLDLPHPIFEAVRIGHIFLSFEELEPDERPPKSIWMDGEKLSAWFDRVKRLREEKYGGRDTHISDPVENEAAKALIVG